MTPDVETPTLLLVAIAEAFNRLQDMDERVDVRFGSVMTNYGYVLQNREGSWEAKLKVGEAPLWWGDGHPHDPDDD